MNVAGALWLLLPRVVGICLSGYLPHCRFHEMKPPWDALRFSENLTVYNRVLGVVWDSRLSRSGV
jgi:hypothetical protein